MNGKGVLVGGAHLALILGVIWALLWLFPPQKADYSRMTQEGKTSFVMRDSCVSLDQAALGRGRIVYLEKRRGNAKEYEPYFNELDALYEKWCKDIWLKTK